MPIQNNLLIDAALGKQTQRVPVWLMRQAGRILPSYRELRSKFPDFQTFIKTPIAAAEATLQPVDELGVDAAIIFSDILVIPEAMGLSYEMVEKTGPYFNRYIEREQDVDALRISQPEESLSYVTNAIKLVKNELNGRVPLIGFAGAPWTIFAYMTEGKGSKTFSKARKWLYQKPEASHSLLDKITQSTILYLKAQIAAGADMVQIFDSWAGILPPHQYSLFSLPYISAICNAITEVPVTVFAKDAYFARHELGKLSCQVVGLDWCMDVQESRILMPNKTLQGNLDPCALYLDYNGLKKETEKMLEAFGPNKYIANLGHGLYPDIEKDKVKFFVETVKGYQASPPAPLRERRV